jgi:phosphomannomutase
MERPKGCTLALARDMREGSQRLHQAILPAWLELGHRVMDLGIVPSEVLYDAVCHHKLEGGIMITASHNPKGYNGMKPVLRQAQPWGSESEIQRLKMSMAQPTPLRPSSPGQVMEVDALSQVIARGAQEGQDLKNKLEQRQLKILCHGLGGCGSLLNAPVMEQCGIETTWLGKQPKPEVPPWGPHPQRPEVVQEVKSAMRAGDFDLGVAWDGDADRCIFFDEQGELADGGAIAAWLSHIALEKYPCSTVIYSKKQCLAVLEAIKSRGGRGVAALTGHAHFKMAMAQHAAVYGTEPSGHHYFKAFHGCDSGMLPWLWLLSDFLKEDLPFSQRLKAFSSGVCSLPEMDLQLDDWVSAFEAYLAKNAHKELHVENFDGINLSIPSEGWRMNLRPSLTEPTLRLNLEGHLSPSILKRHAKDLQETLRSQQELDVSS